MEIKIFSNKEKNNNRNINHRLNELKIALPKLIQNKNILSIIAKEEKLHGKES